MKRIAALLAGLVVITGCSGDEPPETERPTRDFAYDRSVPDMSVDHGLQTLDMVWDTVDSELRRDTCYIWSEDPDLAIAMMYDVSNGDIPRKELAVWLMGKCD